CSTILHTPLTTSLFLGLNQLDYTLNVFSIFNLPNVSKFGTCLSFFFIVNCKVSVYYMTRGNYYHADVAKQAQVNMFTSTISLASIRSTFAFCVRFRLSLQRYRQVQAIINSNLIIKICSLNFASN
ncbi:hypothetical protein ACJX0J_017681, partial [Zea mays]